MRRLGRAVQKFSLVLKMVTIAWVCGGGASADAACDSGSFVSDPSAIDSSALSVYLDNCGDHPRSMLDMGDQLKRDGRLDAARQIFERAAQFNAVTFDAHARLGDIALAQGDRVGAVRLYRGMLTILAIERDKGDPHGLAEFRQTYVDRLLAIDPSGRVAHGVPVFRVPPSPATPIDRQTARPRPAGAHYAALMESASSEQRASSPHFNPMPPALPPVGGRAGASGLVVLPGSPSALLSSGTARTLLNSAGAGLPGTEFPGGASDTLGPQVLVPFAPNSCQSALGRAGPICAGAGVGRLGTVAGAGANKGVGAGPGVGKGPGGSNGSLFPMVASRSGLGLGPAALPGEPSAGGPLSGVLGQGIGQETARADATETPQTELPQKMVAADKVVEKLTSDPAETNGSSKPVYRSEPHVDVPVLFEFDSDVLTLGAHKQIVEIARALLSEQLLASRILLEGHTDAEGTYTYNLRLSKSRAQSVLKALVAAGVVRERLEAEGRGEFQPIAPNDSDAGRAQNRRVTFVNLGPT